MQHLFPDSQVGVKRGSGRVGRGRLDKERMDNVFRRFRFQFFRPGWGEIFGAVAGCNAATLRNLSSCACVNFSNR